MAQPEKVTELTAQLEKMRVASNEDSKVSSFEVPPHILITLCRAILLPHDSARTALQCLWSLALSRRSS